MSRKYFGTDGIRGRVGEHPITPEFMLKLGWAAGRVLCPNGSGQNKVIIGKDTRISGYMIESALEAGLSAAGMHVRLLGPMPTPAVAYLTRTLHASAGIVVSASHNPHYDNGIKFFSGEGEKLPESVEEAIEAELEKPLTTVESALLGKVKRIEDAAGRYIEFCKGTIPSMMQFPKLKIVVDCANGATYHIAANVFTELGAKVIPIGVTPDGVNINVNCGSTYPLLLKNRVMDEGADIGIALDGDGDRVILVDHLGNIVDGDEILYIIARARKELNQMKGNAVGTLMSNLGLEHALAELGIGLERSAVGDRYVLEMMKQKNCTIGGESSGHIICLDRTTSGDGIVSALQVLAAMQEMDQSLAEIRQPMRKYPQELVNVKVQWKPGSDELPGIRTAVQQAELALGESGRVLLRPSGTEPVVRVMVEGVDEIQVKKLAQDIAAAVQLALR